MAIPLRQSTASQEIPLGPALDNADGDTEDATLLLANTDIKIWKNGATTLANKNSGGATNISGGIYYTVLDATDTNTLGAMVVYVHGTGVLALKQECIVFPANVYDALFAGTDKLQVHADEITNGLITAAAIATGAIDADAIADNAIDAGAIATDAITAAKLAADVTTELQSGLATAANLATVAGYLDTEIAAILEDTGTTLPAQISALNNLSAAQVNAEVDTALADVNLDHLVKIAVDTDFPTTVHLNSVIGYLADNGTAASFDRTTDSLEALQGGSAPTAAAIADAVCDELLADHTTNGSLSWYIDGIKDQTDTITSGQIQVVGAFAGTSLTIRRGDTYSTASGQTLAVSKPSGASWPADISAAGWTLTFYADVMSNHTAEVGGSDVSTLTVTATATSATTFRIDLTAAQTASLFVGANKWEWEVEAVHATNGTNTLISGSMTVVGDLS
jgi:hypothetical protein